MSPLTIDINADMGESAERLANGSDAELMRYISSANIACGGHAGDPSTMEQTLDLAKKNQVAAGAHPSYPDRPGFGRHVVSLAMNELQLSIADQVNALQAIARRLNSNITHVKPHGALYHSCNEDQAVARAVARAVLAVDPRLVVVGQSGFSCLEIYREMGLRAAAEAFADRSYEPDGRLRSRSLPGALLESPEPASSQAVEIAARKRVRTTSGYLVVEADTICVHSDTNGAEQIAQAVRNRLILSGVSVQAL